jgi:hypothetical protein
VQKDYGMLWTSYITDNYENIFLNGLKKITRNFSLGELVRRHWHQEEVEDEV